MLVLKVFTTGNTLAVKNAGLENEYSCGLICTSHYISNWNSQPSYTGSTNNIDWTLSPNKHQTTANLALYHLILCENIINLKALVFTSERPENELQQ